MKHLLASIALLVVLATTAFATDVTISATTVANSRGYSGNVRLRIYYTGCSGSNFLDSTGQVVMCGTVGSATGFYAEIPVTVVGSSLTIPAHILPSTDDSSTPTVTATAVFFVNNARRDFWYSNWIITRTLGPSVSFAQLWDYNKTAIPSPATSTTLTASGISQLIRDSSQAPIVETPAGLVNGANATFTISQSIVLDSDELFLNGVRQERITTACTPGTETYSISGQTITHCLPPQTGDVLIVTYRIAAALIGTVDPAVRIRETSGPTTLLIQGIADGQCLRRTGLTVDGIACGGGGGGGLNDPGSNGLVKRTALNTTVAATSGVDYLLPSGSGAALTALNATQLTSGTVPDARFPGVLPAVSGVNLTNLNASNLASGTVADARLSANIPKLNTVNAFTVDNTFGSSVGIGTITPARPLEVLSAAQSQLRLTHTDGSAYTDLTVGAGGTLTVSPTGSYVFDTAGNQIDPAVNFDQNLGQLSKKYLTLYAAELSVETLVAQDTIATIGGRILVGPTTMLVADLSSIQTSIDVKHNNLANGDRVYLEAGGNVEFLAITNNGQVLANGYRYSVTRNLDGTGANAWIAGDAVFNTGTTGDGFIDLYSVRGVKASSELGPTIVGNARNSPNFNDWSPRWAIGNLNGLYGYSSDTYGVALGVPTAAWVKIDPTNGVRIGHNLTTSTQIDALGNATFSGTIAAPAGAIGGWTISQGGFNGVVIPTTLVGGTMGGSGGAQFTKTAANALWNASYWGGTQPMTADGQISWTAIGAANWYSVVGLSDVDGAIGIPTSVRYGIGMLNGALEFYANGATLATSTFVNGVTQLIVRRTGTDITYYRDGVLMATSASQPTVPLYLDGAFFTNAGVPVSNPVTMISTPDGISSPGVALLSGVTGGLAFGTTPPTSASVGTGIWLDKTGLYGLFSDAVLTKVDAVTGELTATNVTITGAITASSGSITGPLTISGASGSLAFGITPPTSASVGTGLWLDRTGLYGLLSNVVQTKIDATTGAITAGAGNVSLSASGLVIETGAASGSAINWVDTPDGSMPSNRSAWIDVNRSGSPLNTLFTMTSRALAIDTTGTTTLVISAQNDINALSAIRLRSFGSGGSGTSRINLFAPNGTVVSDIDSTTLAPASTALEISSTTGALLPPRMTTAQRDALTPTNGMVLYNSTTDKLQIRAAGAWVDLH